MNKFIYMDAAASFLKPQAVLESEGDFLRNRYANAGRGVCERAAAVDDMVDKTRRFVAKFIGADADSIVFTFGATDGFNRIVNILKNTPGMLNKNTVCAVSDLDHHSFRGPFEMSPAKTIVCPLDKNMDIDIKRIPCADILLITAMSNVLGHAQNVKKIISVARKANPNVIAIVDCAQYVVHEKIDVKKWDCDFMCFSGHKIGADTGVGVMYIKNPKRFSPDKFGGGMVAKIYGKKWILESAPICFEAGTLPITQIAGLMPAIDSLIDKRPDLDLIKYMYDELDYLKQIKILSKRDAAILSFVIDGMHPLDVGTILGVNNICVRVGNMCASWIHKYMSVSGCVRLSVGPWNTKSDARAVIKAIKKIVEK
ncbi:MAG: aminotransferase class V-fold PLP-dependent enzyme [Proteobacteria bacterium]|nr:aminotransferase class V-fold PLP-dependent enzyme [Candidatus Enterousia scatequi]